MTPAEEDAGFIRFPLRRDEGVPRELEIMSAIWILVTELPVASRAVAVDWLVARARGEEA